MLTYLTIGVIYSFIMHLLWDYNKRMDENFDTERWTLWESFILTFTWPIYLAYFLWSFFVSFFKEEEE